MSVIPEKPNLSLYFGQVVKNVVCEDMADAPWKWTLHFENGVVIQNYSKDEVHPPFAFIGWRFLSMSMSQYDTSLHFQNPANKKIKKWGLKPTSYTVHDPRHGGEVIPQWPEELEERGIAPEDIGQVSDPPPETWLKDYTQSIKVGEARTQANAQEFLKED